MQPHEMQSLDWVVLDQLLLLGEETFSGFLPVEEAAGHWTLHERVAEHHAAYGESAAQREDLVYEHRPQLKIITSPAPPLPSLRRYFSGVQFSGADG